MTIHLLSRFKIQSLNKSGELIIDDIMTLLKDKAVKIIDDPEIADIIFNSSDNLKYKYSISVSLDRAKGK